MRYKEEYSEAYSTELIDILSRNRIKYKNVRSTNAKTQLVHFTLYRDDIRTAKLHNHGINPQTTSIEYAIREVLYAEWLCIHPKPSRIAIRNFDNTFDYRCGHTEHLIRGHDRMQTGLLTLANEIHWPSNKTFYSTRNGDGIILINKSVKKIIQENDVRGIILRDVALKHGHLSDTTYQLDAQERAIIECWEKNETHHNACPICGEYIIPLNWNQQIFVAKDCLNCYCDIYTSSNVINDGRAYTIYIISQHLHRLLLDYGMTRGVEFIPVFCT